MIKYEKTFSDLKKLKVNYFKSHVLYIYILIQIGEAAKLKPMELELKRLEDLSEAIVQDFTIMRKREEEMRDTNGNNIFLFVIEIIKN